MIASRLLRPSTIRSFSVLSRSTILRASASSSLAQARAAPLRCFSVQSRLLQADKTLLTKLNEEYKYEAESLEESGLDVNGTVKPDFLKEFESNSEFKVVAKAGEKEVVLKKTYGEEEISVTFSIDSVANAQPDMDMDIDETETKEKDEEDESFSFPIPTTISIYKPNTAQSALQFHTTVQDGAFFIDQVNFYKDGAKLLADDTAEGDWVRAGRYSGPVFEDLDEDLQDSFHKVLEERGLNESVANFMMDYIEYKEQLEYMRWLKNVENFVKA